jgi:hypothetical protein
MGRKESVEIATPVAVLPVASPNQGLHELALVGVAAERAGWLPEEAFEAALLLRITGMPTYTSIAAFEHAARWLQ